MSQHVFATEKAELPMDFQGLPLVIEWPKGSTREGTNEDGTKWTRTMYSDYGYIDDTKGAGDREPVDVYVGDDDGAQTAFVFEQLKQDGSFDEYKIVLGVGNKSKAEALYLAHYPKEWKEKRMGGVWEFPVSRLRTEVEKQ